LTGTSINIRRPIILAAVGLIVVLATLWWTLRSGSDRGDVPVIIYLVDTLRADRLGAYGYRRSISPEIDALAAESVLFEQAYAPAPWTLPSVSSLITSTYTCEHGLALKKKLNPALKTLAERLQSVGYLNGGAYNNLWVGPLAGLDRGYDLLSERTLAQQGRAGDVRQFLDQVNDQPFLMYLHTMEPHDTYLTPYRFFSETGHVSVDLRKNYETLISDYNAARQADWMAGKAVGVTDNTDEQEKLFSSLLGMQDSIELLYDGAVRWADHNLGEVIDVLKERGVWDRAIFIFLSDHGEELGDHGGWLHGQSVYEELVRIPLLIHFPGGEHAGRRVDPPVSLVDIMPTIFDYLGRADLCAGCRGVSLLPLVVGKTHQTASRYSIPALRANRAFYFRPYKESRGDLNVVVRQDRWKGIWNEELSALELYDLDLDPNEKLDVSAQYPELSNAMSQEARNWIDDCHARASQPEDIGKLDIQTQEKLRALGYFN
jgi:arylsulfatase A-like enzyme